MTTRTRCGVALTLITLAPPRRPESGAGIVSNFPRVSSSKHRMSHPIAPASTPASSERVLIRGIHLALTEPLRHAIEVKAERLLRHAGRIDRVRIDLEHDTTRQPDTAFVAKGHIEIGGPDLLASVASDDAYKSLDLLIDKLDGLLRRRAGLRKDKRNHPHAIDLESQLPKIE